MQRPYILLVEDDPDERELALRLLRKTKEEVIAVSDGEEALDYILERGEESGGEQINLPIVILLDLKMPGIDGFGVLEVLRSDPRTDTIPVVVFTCSQEAQDVTKSFKMGANSYVKKPVDYVEFAKTLKSMEHYWVNINERQPATSDLNFTASCGPITNPLDLG